MNNTIVNTEAMRNEYETNLQGFVFIARQENKQLIINENNQEITCNAKDFWKTVNIDVMDIDAENLEFKKCEYINDSSVLVEYGTRIIKIEIAK